MSSKNLVSIPRPIISATAFDSACGKAHLSSDQLELIDFIRYIGVFNQLTLTQSLGLSSKPPALSILCETCRLIGKEIPKHFADIRS